MCNRPSSAVPHYADVRISPDGIDSYHQSVILLCYRFHTCSAETVMYTTQPALSGNSRWVFPASDPAAGGRPESGHDPSKAAQERMATMRGRDVCRPACACISSVDGCHVACPPAGKWSRGIDTRQRGWYRGRLDECPALVPQWGRGLFALKPGVPAPNDRVFGRELLWIPATSDFSTPHSTH